MSEGGYRQTLLAARIGNGGHRPFDAVCRRGVETAVRLFQEGRADAHRMCCACGALAVTATGDGGHRLIGSGAGGVEAEFHQVRGRDRVLDPTGHHRAQRLVQARYARFLPLALAVAHRYEGRRHHRAVVLGQDAPQRGSGVSRLPCIGWASQPDQRGAHQHLLAAVGARYGRQWLTRVVHPICALVGMGRMVIDTVATFDQAPAGSWAR